MAFTLIISNNQSDIDAYTAMKQPLSVFTDHPNSVGESYFEHFLTASGFATKMFIGSLACLVHALFPFWCTKTGSQAITELHGRMVTHRDKNSCDGDEATPEK